jgi:hypothetical protein
MSNTPLPIEVLIRSRSNELGLRLTDLVLRSGYRNVAKGLRRLDQLYAGNFDGASGLIERLPSALDLPKTTIEQAVEESRRQIAEAKEEAWRAAFKPHAVILTDRKRPEPLFAAAIIGIDQLKRVDFAPASSPLTFIHQALDGLRKKLERWKGQIPCFGKPTGIIINYSPDRAVRFGLDGQPLEMLDGAYRLGQASLSIGARKCSSGELTGVLLEGASG